MFEFLFTSIAMFFPIWVQLACATMSLPMNLFCSFITWSTSLLSLPARALLALQREKQVVRQLQAMQSEVENLHWRNRELETDFQIAVNENHVLESMLAELEEGHDKAIMEIEHLESKMQALKEENQQLREMQGKAYWNNAGDAGKNDVPSDIHSWKLRAIGHGGTLESLTVQKGSKEKDYKGWSGSSNSKGLVGRSKSSDIYMDDLALSQRRNAALFQSLFSAILSVLVGLIIYESDDPCMPLVVALFIVVGMSLKSVVQFFSTIKNKPASDAVSLLSLNWFILGTLAYPSLPTIARALSPLIVSFISIT